MSKTHVLGIQEQFGDAQHTLRLILAASTLERRLEGLSVGELLRGLSLEEIVGGLSPAQKTRMLELLDQGDR